MDSRYIEAWRNSGARDIVTNAGLEKAVRNAIDGVPILVPVVNDKLGRVMYVPVTKAALITGMNVGGYPFAGDKRLEPDHPAAFELVKDFDEGTGELLHYMLEYV